MKKYSCHLYTIGIHAGNLYGALAGTAEWSSLTGGVMVNKYAPVRKNLFQQMFDKDYFFSCSLSQTLVEGVIRIKTRKEKYWPLLEYLRMCTAHYTNMDEDDDVLEKRSRLPAP